MDGSESGNLPYGEIANAAVAISGDRIVWVGIMSELPSGLREGAGNSLDARGRWVTPGLIDCHTHLVFAGNRASEFEMRLRGATYEEIARGGGGIASTVRATRAATDEELFSEASKRLSTLGSLGVTTVEVKSGYGLDTETELRMLRVARRLGTEHPVTLRTTFLGAHALAPEYADDRSGYLDLVCDTMIPRVTDEGLADGIDAFCEGIAFTPEECERVFAAGTRRGLSIRIHADQLSDCGGAALAARVGAMSADHLEYASEAGIQAMAKSETTAVLLPGAFYFLREQKAPPVDALRLHGVPIAIATDLNPGSSPINSPLTAMNMACVLFGLSPEEALCGMTRNAAKVLGMAGERGVLRVGSYADLAVWNIGHPSELSYWVGGNPCEAVVQGGAVINRIDQRH
ncbi:MAG TPA: imidazolonepropionase [Gemmatimonadetes bacterium]|nr:imidazolonepropionase [Gemmatimonadota bacterium]